MDIRQVCSHLRVVLHLEEMGQLVRMQNAQRNRMGRSLFFGLDSDQYSHFPYHAQNQNTSHISISDEEGSSILPLHSGVLSR